MPSKFHRSIGRERTDTQADVDHRIAARAAGERAVREREAKFPTLGAENVQEAMDWQEARLRELMAPIDARWSDARGRRRGRGPY